MDGVLEKEETYHHVAGSLYAHQLYPVCFEFNLSNLTCLQSTLNVALLHSLNFQEDSEFFR